jgi:hypothetical protein
MISIFIRNNEKNFPVEKMYRVLQVGESSYYQWKSQSEVAALFSRPSQI